MTYEHPAIYALESVGTMITSKGMTYPMLREGAYDSSNGVHLSDIEPDGDWFNGLSDADRLIVGAVRHSISPGPTAFEQTQY